MTPQGSIGANEAACLRAACRTLARKAAAQAMLRGKDSTPQHVETIAEVTSTVQECGQLVELLWARGAGFVFAQVPSSRLGNIHHWPMRLTAACC